MLRDRIDSRILLYILIRLSYYRRTNHQKNCLECTVIELELAERHAQGYLRQGRGLLALVEQRRPIDIG